TGERGRRGIRRIVARTERALLNMAAGYSRACNGRRLGVAAVQHGPGAENAYAGVAQSFADGSPLLFLPGGNPATRADLPPNFDPPRSYQSVTKWSARVNAPQRAPALLRRARPLPPGRRPPPPPLQRPAG